MSPLRVFALALTLLLGLAGPGLAATPSDFYLDLLKKGVAEYDAARYDGAVTLLRVAAFGLLEFPNHYQTAQIYRAISADKLNDAAMTRDAAMRTIAAERVQRSYASLSLPASVRTSFESVAKKVLTSSDLSMLTSGTTPPAPVQKPVQQPAIQQPVVQQPVVQQPAVKPPAQPRQKPAESKPTPAKTETPKTETPKPPPQKPQPPKPEPPKVERPAAKPAPKPVETKPVVETPAPPRDVVAMLTSADRALSSGNLTEARRVYRQLLDGTLTHEQAIRVAEGLYRARDFANVLRAFDRVGQLRRGEEPYRFYLAVALYENGRFAAAKKELAAVLDFIEVTPDVARYKTKIESSSD